MALDGWFRLDQVLWRGRKVRALIPSDGLTERQLDEHAPNVYKAKITKPRSVPQHRLYWAVLALVSDNCQLNSEQLHQLVKHATGYSVTVQRKSGEKVTLFGSIAFDKMDGAEFKKFLDAALDFLCDEVIPQLDRGTLLDEARAMLGQEKGGD